MKLLIQSAIIFFGTLLAAALLALGEPGRSDSGAAGEAEVTRVVHQSLEPSRAPVEAAPATALGY